MLYAAFQVQFRDGRKIAEHAIGLYDEKNKAWKGVYRHCQGWKTLTPKYVESWAEFTDESADFTRAVSVHDSNGTRVEFHIVAVRHPAEAT